MPLPKEINDLNERFAALLKGPKNIKEITSFNYKELVFNISLLEEKAEWRGVYRKYINTQLPQKIVDVEEHLERIVKELTKEEYECEEMSYANPNYLYWDERTGPEFLTTEVVILTKIVAVTDEEKERVVLDLREELGYYRDHLIDLAKTAIELDEKSGEIKSEEQISNQITFMLGVEKLGAFIKLLFINGILDEKEYLKAPGKYAELVTRFITTPNKKKIGRLISSDSLYNAITSQEDDNLEFWIKRAKELSADAANMLNNKLLDRKTKQNNEQNRKP